MSDAYWPPFASELLFYLDVVHSAEWHGSAGVISLVPVEENGGFTPPMLLIPKVSVVLASHFRIPLLNPSGLGEWPARQ